MLLMASWVEHKLKLIFLNSFRYAVNHSPRKLFYLIAYLSAVLTYMADHTKVRIMREELGKSLGRRIPGKKIGGIITKGICNNRKDLFETWMFPVLTQEKTRRLAYFSGKENLDAALANGKGVILVLAHFGFRKFILPVLGYEGYAINQVAAKPTSWKLEGKEHAAHNKIMDIELDCEKALRANFIYLKDSLRPIFRALSKNEIVSIAIDGTIGNKRMGVKFFDRIAFLSPTVVSLSLKTGAPMIPAFAIRDNDNRHKIVFEKPLLIKANDGADTESLMREALGDFVNVLEKYVLAYPCHYVDWLYRARIWPIEENFFVFQ